MKEDIAQDVICAWYKLNEFDRPQTQIEYEMWAFDKARDFRRDAVYGSFKDGPIELPGGEDGQMVSILDLQKRCTSPTQYLNVLVKDVFRVIDKMPPNLQEAIFKYIDHGNVVEYARDTGVSLFQAMNELKDAKSMAELLFEEIDLEQKEKHGRICMEIEVSDHAVLRYLERAKGFDIDAVRKEIEDMCAPALDRREFHAEAPEGQFVLHPAARVVSTYLSNDLQMPSRTAMRVAKSKARANAAALAK